MSTINDRGCKSGADLCVVQTTGGARCIWTHRAPKSGCSACLKIVGRGAAGALVCDNLE